MPDPTTSDPTTLDPTTLDPTTLDPTTLDPTTELKPLEPIDPREADARLDLTRLPGSSELRADAPGGRIHGDGWFHDSTEPADDHRLLGLIVALVAAVFVFAQLRPGLLFADNTPAGGDMGAHVWGPAYMRDHLLTSGRLTGWTPDWYAGFPAYHFYMVVPALAVLAVNSGLTPILGLPLALIVLAGAFVVTRRLDVLDRFRVPPSAVWTLAGVVAVLLVGVPYGVAFKLVSVAGLVLFPVAAWAMARLADCREPIPALCAIASTVFLFDTNFTIYGGNVASTLAGEFAFSLSLCLSLFTIGYVMRAMDHGAGRASGAVFIALVALCHIIPLFFMVAALVVISVLHRAVNRLWVVALGVPLTLVPLSMAEGNGPWLLVAALVSAVFVLAAFAIGDPVVRGRVTWLLVSGPVAALLAAFWLLPFYLREPYFNDMGWERRTDISAALLTTPMRWFLPLAVVGAVLALATRDRIGMLFAVLAVMSAAGVSSLPAGKLWNARLLPFYYLSVYILAAVAVGLIVRFCGASLSDRLDRPDGRVVYGAPVVALVVALVAMSVPLRTLPGGTIDAGGVYEWFGLRSSRPSLVPAWVRWNYSGYEEKASYREYREIVDTMDALGRENGCGRAMWEYHEDLDRYGTPMALMLLPHWTDGCIGSMEGLYFESSSTTPFHFLNQSALSEAPSRAQRDLPYQSFDIETGVAQLQLLGVRYYLAQTDLAIGAASEHPDLTEVARSEPWAVFEVAGSELAEGLGVEPVVASGPPEEVVGDLATRFDVGWISQAVTVFNRPQSFAALPAEDGPDHWERVETIVAGDGRELDAAQVSEIEQSRSSIRFTVEEPGTPVLVKISYFPNWSASGADGPWRIGPNLMVVVPTSNEVRLSYGWTAVDVVAHLLSLSAVGGLVVLARRDRPDIRYH